MQRSITGYHCDDLGHWVAELDCGHDQHVRHDPPWQLRPWVVEEAGRNAHLGTPLPCSLCVRRELPTGAVERRVTALFDEHSIPAGLRSRHTTKSGVWAVIEVVEGTLDCRVFTSAPVVLHLRAGDAEAMPPQLEHQVESVGPVRFQVRLLSGRINPRPAD